MSKLLKITFEYDDKIQSLEGEGATEWDKQINDAINTAFAHGTRLTTDKLPWVKKSNNGRYKNLIYKTYYKDGQIEMLKELIAIWKPRDPLEPFTTNAILLELETRLRLLEPKLL